MMYAIIILNKSLSSNKCN